MHRLDLGLYSHPKEFLGNGVRTYVNTEPQPEKFSSEGGSNPQCCVKQDREPNTLPTEILWPPDVHIIFLITKGHTSSIVRRVSCWFFVCLFVFLFVFVCFCFVKMVLHMFCPSTWISLGQVCRDGSSSFGPIFPMAQYYRSLIIQHPGITIK